MLTRDFQVDDAFGTIRKYNARSDDMNSLMLTTLLRKFYPETETLAEEITADNVYGYTRLGSISVFTRIAVRITVLEGAESVWPALRGAEPEAWHGAYEDFLYGDHDLWDEITRIAEELDNPNGIVSGVITEDQAKDPLLSSNGALTLKV